MNIIPKKYLSAEYSLQAQTLVRSWCRDDESLKNALSQLIVDYKDARDEDKRHIGLLSAMILGLKSQEYAEKGIHGLGVKKIPFRSIGESIYCDGYSDTNNVSWRGYFPPCVTKWPTLYEKADLSRHPNLFHNNCLDHVVTINTKDEIHACRHVNGALRIFILNDCERDILIDEENFNDESPLYFTEVSHFVSPVFKLKVAIKILDFLLAEIGYPSLEIIPTVIFTSSGANLLNRESYLPCNEKGYDWKGIEVITRKDIKNIHILQSIVSFSNGQGSSSHIEEAISNKLLEAISATGIMYAKLNLLPTILDLDDKDLRSIAKELGIMPLSA